MIEVENLSKRYEEKLAAGGLDFVVQPPIVTGFLGPNGAGRLDGVTKTCQSGAPPALAQISMGVAAGRWWPSWVPPAAGSPRQRSSRGRGGTSCTRYSNS